MWTLKMGFKSNQSYHAESPDMENILKMTKIIKRYCWENADFYTFKNKVDETML